MSQAPDRLTAWTGRLSQPVIDGVNATAAWISAVLLTLERITYVAIRRSPNRFARMIAAASLGPVDARGLLFAAFKCLEIAVFTGWWVGHGSVPWPGDNGSPRHPFCVVHVRAQRSIRLEFTYSGRKRIRTRSMSRSGRSLPFGDDQ